MPRRRGDQATALGGLYEALDRGMETGTNRTDGSDRTHLLFQSNTALGGYRERQSPANGRTAVSCFVVKLPRWTAQLVSASWFTDSARQLVKKGLAVLEQWKEWEIGEVLGEGGFGKVYVATNGDVEAAVKLVPKEPGAGRDLLMAEVGGARNVIPVLDDGETDDSFVLVMPRAECSLADVLQSSVEDRTELAESVLRDVLECLADLEGDVIHRDIKPANILRLEGRWCLTDFGISRYAEASTAPDTKKFAMTPQYASPEQWNWEHATSAADIYSLGVVAYEIAAGRLPFAGPSSADFREQHLHDSPQLDVLSPPPLASLIGECLRKPASARPRAATLLDRLDQLFQTRDSTGLASLQDANVTVVAEQAKAESEAAKRSTTRRLREQLLDAAVQTLDEVVAEIVDTIVSAAPAAALHRADCSASLELGDARLTISGPRAVNVENLRREHPFDIVAAADIRLQYPRRDRYDHRGRSHSLWYCDAQVEGEYSWFETAFTIMFSQEPRTRLGALSHGEPFALDPGDESAEAVCRGVSHFHVAWPFTPVVPSFIDDVVDRWAGWLADASQGRYRQPTSMPEVKVGNSWRN